MTPIETASSRELTHPRSGPGTPRRRRGASWAARFIVALVCALFFIGWTQACKSGGSSNGPDSGSPVPCPPQAQSTSGAAELLMSGMGVQNKICYQGTSNWYYINVPSGSTLLDIKAGYNAATNTSVELDIKAFYKTNSTTLTLLQELVASSGSGDAGASSLIDTTVHAIQSGDYYLQVSDKTNTNFDANNAYSLDVDYAVDPDSHEPNDTTAQAKVSNGKPGWLAYIGDLDIYKTDVTKAGDLLTLTISNPLTASAEIDYAIASSSGTTLYSSVLPQSDKPVTRTLQVSAAGTYYATLSYPTGSTPSHATSSAYTFSFGSRSNPDTLDNHTLTTAICPGGGSGPCSMQYSGSAITLPKVSSYITVPGQRDFYRIDIASGAALVLDVNLTSSGSTPVKYSVDLLTEDPASPCSADTDCDALNQPCTSAVNMMGIPVTNGCELSHSCLMADSYHFCKSGKCQLCAGAGLCAPNKQCLAPQFLSAYSVSGKQLAGPTVSTAQPLFSNGTYYVNVHDEDYANVDLSNPYTLTLQMVPEPDPNDQSTDPTMRNNFYDPYPNDTIDDTPNEKLAVDITTDLQSGTAVTGWISYASDNDWYSFQHPCPGTTCALDFEWIQPGPSPVQVAFYMLNQDLSAHQSFAYVGDPKKLTMPVPGSFDNQDCHHCSLAAQAQDDGGPYTYYLRVAAVDPTTYDYSSGGMYSVTVTKGADGCPKACSYGRQCGCHCPAPINACPSPGF